MKKKTIYIILSLILCLSVIVGIILQRQKVIHIAYLSDSKYLPYTMVSLNSAIMNKNYKKIYHIHLLALDFTTKDIQKIKTMEQKNVKIDVYNISKKELDLSHLGRFASFDTALQKIFIAEMLPFVDKVLYLDADTIVQQDLSQLYNTNLKEQYVAAVKDGLMYQYPEHIEELPLKNPNFYFNSGVMLMNLKKIREDNLQRKALIYFNTHNEIFGDQDIFNVIFSNKVQALSYRYNCNSVFFEEKGIEFLADFYQESMPENPLNVYTNASILHFAGYKPWTQWFKNPYLKTIWSAYAKDASSKYSIAF